jgi:hypothetical protein
MFESHYKHIYSGDMIIAQRIQNQLNKIGVNAIIKDDNQTGVSAMLAEDVQGLKEIYVHEDELEKAKKILSEVLDTIA